MNYARILVPVDGSPCGDAAVLHALSVARAMRSTVLFLFVMDTLTERWEGVVNAAEALDALTLRGKALLDAAQAAAAEVGVESYAELVEGSPAEIISARAAEFDLVVMGSHGKGLLARITAGSVTRSVLNKIVQPLLVVRAEDGGRTTE